MALYFLRTRRAYPTFTGIHTPAAW